MFYDSWFAGFLSYDKKAKGEERASVTRRVALEFFAVQQAMERRSEINMNGKLLCVVEDRRNENGP